MNFPPVLTKRDFVERFIANEFGNHTPTWGSITEFYAHFLGPYTSLGDYRFHLRNRIAGGATHYRLKDWQIIYLWENKDNQLDWYCSEQIPEHVEKQLRIQGEVFEDTEGLRLYYSTVPLPMREALATSAQEVKGLRALETLKWALCPTSMEWMRVLFERYPGHVVEFSSYNIDFGTIPGYNTIFWEVRGGY